MDINLFQTITLGLLQGFSELFPISSLGHTVILAAIFHWKDILQNPDFVSLIVALHLGTSIALIIYFYKDWKNIIISIYKSVLKGDIDKHSDEWTSWLIIIGTIPAGIIGLFLEKPIKSLFVSPIVSSIFLIVNGAILYIGEIYIKKKNTKKLSEFTWKNALTVGFAQSFALIPGISRSGISMVSSLILGLNHEDSARYSFLLGTPIITAAAVLEIPQLINSNLNLTYILIGSIISSITAYISIKFLLKYFHSGNLIPFSIYCVIAGIIYSVLILV